LDSSSSFVIFSRFLNALRAFFSSSSVLGITGSFRVGHEVYRER
jgi:hypothetical protein